MKITGIEAYQVDLPLHEGSYKWSGGKSVSVFDSTVVLIDTDEGVTGCGEVCPLGPFYLPAYASGARAGIAELGPSLLGEDPRQTRRLYRLMERTLELAMSGEVKSQNAPFLLRGAIGNLHHGRDAWEFVRRNWAEINELFPRNTISRIVESIRLLDRPEDVAQAQAFFAEHHVEQAAKTLEQILERQRVNADVRSHNEQPLRESLRA